MKKTILACCLLLGGKALSQMYTEQIYVKGNSTLIYSGDTSPSTIDGTDFGSSAVCSEKMQTFEVSPVNVSQGVYTSFMSVSIYGPNASDFVLYYTAMPPITFSSIANQPYYFSIYFRPTSTGVKNAIVSVEYRAGMPNNGPSYYYNYYITGNGTPGSAPVITSVTPASRCGSGSVTLGATASYGTLYWYSNSNGSGQVGSGTSYTTPVLSSTRSYYVQSISSSCLSPITPVTATINTVIPADDPLDVFACESYVLPALTSGSYYTGPGGTGTLLGVGTSITSTQTIYVYSESGTVPNCTSENSFVVTIDSGTPVINSVTEASSCSAASLNLAVNASSGTISWFDASSGGTQLASGSNYNTPILSSNTTYYVSSANGACVSARVPVTAAIGNCTQLNSFSCNRVMNLNSETIECNPVAGASAYRFELINGSTTLNYQSASNQLSINSIAGLKYATTYSVRAAAQVGGVWSAYGSACNLTTPKTSLINEQCTSTINEMTDVLSCYEVQDATSYRFEVSLGSNVYTVTSTTPGFQMSSISALKYYTTYKVRVASLVGGVWSAYGPDCYVTTPLTRLLPSFCGTTISNQNQNITCFAVNGASKYQFQLTEGSTVLTYISTSVNFRLKNVSGVLPGKTYAVRVASLVGTVWSAYGPPCSISTSSSASIMMHEEGIGSEQANGHSVPNQKSVLETYPNPANGKFTIKTDQEAEFSIFNELGQLVRKVALTEEGKFEVEISDLEHGVYIIFGTLNGQQEIRKLFVTD